MLQAVCFDLDGTITRPTLDFNLIRSEIGPLLGPAGQGTMLDQMMRLPAEERDRALEILYRHEREAARRAQLNEGVLELLEFIRRRRLRTAIITRNSAATTTATLSNIGLSFEEVLTRDSGLPLKPDPAPLVHLCRQWGLKPWQMLMVGDYRYDTDAGRAAGTLTCLVTNGRDASAETADFVVKHPGEVIGVIRKAEEEKE